MVGLKKSTDIWKCLCTSYASRTRATIKKLKLLLKTPKNNKFVSTYLLDIKKTVDHLATVGATEEHIEAILDGLSDEYDGFITSILSRTDPYSVDDLEALLLAQEERYTKRNRHFSRPILFREISLLQTLQILVLGLTLILLVVAVCFQETMVLLTPIALPILIFPTTMLKISICLSTPLNISARFVAKLVI